TTGLKWAYAVNGMGFHAVRDRRPIRPLFVHEHLIQGIFFCGLIGQSRKERIPRNVLVKTSGDRCRHLSIPLSYQLCQLTGLMVQYTSVPLASFTLTTEGPPMLPGVPVLRLATNMR